MNNDQNIDVIRKRLYYRAMHRGTKEMDLLLGSFAGKYISELSKLELREFEELLNISDQDLYDFYNRRLIPSRFADSRVLKLFISFRV